MWSVWIELKKPQNTDILTGTCTCNVRLSMVGFLDDPRRHGWPNEQKRQIRRFRLWRVLSRETSWTLTNNQVVNHHFPPHSGSFLHNLLFISYDDHWQDLLETKPLEPTHMSPTPNEHMPSDTILSIAGCLSSRTTSFTGKLVRCSPASVDLISLSTWRIILH